MSNDVNIKLPFPAVRYCFSAMYSKTEKPSGLGYMILKMVGSKVLSDKMKFEKLMEDFGLPYDLFPLLKEEIENLKDNGMVESDEGFDVGSMISAVRLTQQGEEAFKKGVISIKPEKKGGEIFYLPGRIDKLTVDFKSQQLSETPFDFREISADPDDLEVYVKANKSKFGVGENEDIFDFKIVDEDQYIFDKKMTMSFDPLSAKFSAPYSGDADSRFIKEQFSIGFLMEKIGDSLFNMPEIIDVLAWSKDMPSWDEYVFMLPCNMNLKGAVCIADANVCKISDSFNMPERCRKEETKLIVIDSSSVGTKYAFVRSKIGIKGIDGYVEKNLAVQQRMGQNEVDACIKDVLQNIDVADEAGFQRGVDLCRHQSDSSEVRRIILRRLNAVNMNSFLSVVKSLDKHKGAKWFKDIPDIVEEALCEKSEPPMNDKMLIQTIADFKRIGISINGTKILPKLFSTDGDKISIADDCLEAGLSAKGVISLSGVAGPVADRILRGADIPGKSSEFSMFSNISHNLAELKEITGIASTSKYALDIDGLDAESSKRIIDSSYTLSTHCAKLGKEPYFLDLGKAGLSEVLKFEKLFAELSDVLKGTTSGKIMTKEDLMREKNPIILGIQLAKNLENTLSGQFSLKGSLENMIGEAHEKKLINDKDFDTLDKFRQFRNRCAHEMQPSVRFTEKDRHKWINIVFSLKMEA